MPYLPCTYLKRDGSVCGRRSIRGICGQHTGCNSQRPCLLCGRGTQSATGVCGTRGECRAAQHAALLRFQRIAKKEKASDPPPVSGTDLDTLVDELLA